jgi:hypothetical protein
MIRYFKVRKAMRQVLANNEEFLKLLAESEKDVKADNLTWIEENTWKAWTYSEKNNKYYFDDIGNESLSGIWEDEFLNQGGRY